MNQGSIQHCFALQSEAFISSSGFLVRKWVFVPPEFMEVIAHYSKMLDWMHWGSEHPALVPAAVQVRAVQGMHCRALVSLWICQLKPHALHTQPACKQGPVSLHCWGSDFLWLTCWTICITLQLATLFLSSSDNLQAEIKNTARKTEGNRVALARLYATIQISKEYGIVNWKQ